MTPTPSVAPIRPGSNKLVTHELKCWPGYFGAILDGTKTFEVRKNDRHFTTGDSLRLREWDPDTEVYSGRETTVDVAYIVGLAAWGAPQDLCVMAVRPRTAPSSGPAHGVAVHPSHLPTVVDLLEDDVERLKALVERTRHETIEECAKVCDERATKHGYHATRLREEETADEDSAEVYASWHDTAQAVAEGMGKRIRALPKGSETR